MLIGGFTPFTLTDFPGEIAAICFTQGCNFSCPFCHNRLLIPQKVQSSPGGSMEDTREVLDFLSRRKGRLNALVVSGGEPTLQEDLEPFLEEVRSLGLKIKLDTNGSRPWVLKGLIEGRLVDFVAMDIKAPWEKYGLLAGAPVDTAAIERSMNLILDSDIRHLFRTTFVPHLLNQDDLERIRKTLPSRACYKVQPYVKPGLAA